MGDTVRVGLMDEHSLSAPYARVKNGGVAIPRELWDRYCSIMLDLEGVLDEIDTVYVRGGV